jgi:hypothetical protein
MGQKLISGYANESSIVSTSEFLVEKSDGSYVALTWAVISSMAEIGKERTAYNETEATAIINSGKYLELSDSGNPSNATYNVAVSTYPLLAAARPEWVSGSNIAIPNLYNRVERIKGTDTGNAGTLLADQFQGHWHASDGDTTPCTYDVNNSGTFKYVQGSANQTSLTPAYVNDGTNGTPLVGTETRGKAFIVRKFVRALI